MSSNSDSSFCTNFEQYNHAIIDIGTNSVRLMLVKLLNGKIIAKKKELCTTRLGKNLYRSGFIDKDRMLATFEAVEKYVNKARYVGISDIRIFSTNAMRIAKNSDELVKLVHEKTGLYIEIISGEKEAKIGYIGAVEVLDKNDSTALVVDIGGGSTEVILGSIQNINYIKSFELGIVRLTEKFDISGNFDFFDEELYNDYLHSIARAKIYVAEMIQELPKFEKDISLIGVAGTITTLVQIHNQVAEYNEDAIHGEVLKLEDLQLMFKMICNVSLETRRNIVGLPFKRADVIVAGLIILICIMENLSRDEIIVSSSDNLEGYIYDMLAKKSS